jgi:1,4-dihydroxy-2-naphthoyl-CoA synthase
MGSRITLDYVEAYLTEDAREGIQAFLDERSARFRGR